MYRYIFPVVFWLDCIIFILPYIPRDRNRLFYREWKSREIKFYSNSNNFLSQNKNYNVNSSHISFYRFTVVTLCKQYLYPMDSYKRPLWNQSPMLNRQWHQSLCWNLEWRYFPFDQQRHKLDFSRLNERLFHYYGFYCDPKWVGGHQSLCRNWK